LFDRSLLGDLITTVSTFQTSTPAGILTDTQEVIQAATNTPGFNFNNLPLGSSGSSQSLATSNRVGGQALSSFAVGRTNTELGFGGLVLSASSESVSVLIRALQETRRIEVLSRPQIMTLDNQPAFIQVGQRVPRIIGTQINQVGQVNSVALENVGLILGVTPRISPTGMVVMEIDAERSEVGPDAEGIPISVSATGEIIRSPRIDTTTAQTTVSAASGETIVLGGLITKRKNTIHRRVPYLNDIPLLGHLFRYDLKTERRFELLIIMTPRVIRTPEDAQQLRHVEESRINWAASDVAEIHGRGHVRGTEDRPYCEVDVPVIYPDANPRGILPEALPQQPAEALPAPDFGGASTHQQPGVEKTSYDQPNTESSPPRRLPNRHTTGSKSPVMRLPLVTTNPAVPRPAATETVENTTVSHQDPTPASSTKTGSFPGRLFSLFKKKSPSTH
ncbi:MAG: type II secretion system protein GspD, partial [Pirellulales bacterium]